jgi:outer membrane protein assembly factor BamC
MISVLKRMVAALFPIFLTLVFIGGCAFFGEKGVSSNENRKFSSKQGLDVPPDLIRPSTDDRYSLPASGTTKLSEFGTSDRGMSNSPSSSKILPNSSSAYLVNYGSFKILIVKKPPEDLWNPLKNFWLQSGFKIDVEVPESGLIETGWMEKKTKLSDGIIRNTLGKIFEGLYDTGERDKFRMRIERTVDNYSEISIAHKGLMQVVSEDRSDNTVMWVNKKPDRQLEDLYLRNVISYFTAKEGSTGKISEEVKESVAYLKGEEKNKFIEIEQSFKSTWKSVGLIVDRLGFDVEDRVESEGVYLVRYREFGDNSDKKGFFKKLFSSDEEVVNLSIFKITIQGSDGLSRISVKDYEKDKITESSNNILSVILEQLS